MVKRMAGTEGISATALARETGIAQPTLSRWLRQASSVGVMSHEGSQHESGKQSGGQRKWTTEEKLRVVVGASGLSDAELGAFLRREGVHEAQLKEWRAAVAGALGTTSEPRKNSREAKRIRELEKDLRRKEKALAEVTALLALKKRVHEIWGDEDDSTGTRSET